MEKASDGSFPVFFVPAEMTIERRVSKCGSLEEGIKRDALLTSAMQPCRRRLTLTLSQASLAGAVSKASRFIPSSLRRIGGRMLRSR
jgi:hypothetical protein